MWFHSLLVSHYITSVDNNEKWWRGTNNHKMCIEVHIYTMDSFEFLVTNIIRTSEHPTVHCSYCSLSCLSSSATFFTYDANDHQKHHHFHLSLIKCSKRKWNKFYCWLAIARVILCYYRNVWTFFFFLFAWILLMRDIDI